MNLKIFVSIIIVFSLIINQTVYAKNISSYITNSPSKVIDQANNTLLTPPNSIAENKPAKPELKVKEYTNSDFAWDLEINPLKLLSFFNILRNFLLTPPALVPVLLGIVMAGIGFAVKPVKLWGFKLIQKTLQISTGDFIVLDIIKYAPANKNAIYKFSESKPKNNHFIKKTEKQSLQKMSVNLNLFSYNFPFYITMDKKTLNNWLWLQYKNSVEYKGPSKAFLSKQEINQKCRTYIKYSRDFVLRQDALSVLAELPLSPDEIFPVLIEVLKTDKNEYVRRWAAKIIAYDYGHYAKALIPVLSGLIKNDKSETVRSSLENAIERMKKYNSLNHSSTALEEIIHKLKYGKQPAIRSNAAIELEYLYTPYAQKAIPALEFAIKNDPDKRVRNNAARALFSIKRHKRLKNNTFDIYELTDEYFWKSQHGPNKISSLRKLLVLGSAYDSAKRAVEKSLKYEEDVQTRECAEKVYAKLLFYKWQNELKLGQKEFFNANITPGDNGELIVRYILYPKTKYSSTNLKPSIISIPLKLLFSPKQMWGEPQLNGNNIAFLGKTDVFTKLSIKSAPSSSNYTCPYLWIPDDAKETTIHKLSVNFPKGQPEYKIALQIIKHICSEQLMRSFPDLKQAFIKSVSYILKDLDDIGDVLLKIQDRKPEYDTAAGYYTTDDIDNISHIIRANIESENLNEIKDIKLMVKKHNKSTYLIGNCRYKGHLIAGAVSIINNKPSSIHFGIKGEKINIGCAFNITPELLNIFEQFLGVPVELKLSTTEGNELNLLFNKNGSKTSFLKAVADVILKIPSRKKESEIRITKLFDIAQSELEKIKPTSSYKKTNSLFKKIFSKLDTGSPFSFYIRSFQPNISLFFDTKKNQKNIPAKNTHKAKDKVSSVIKKFTAIKDRVKAVDFLIKENALSLMTEILKNPFEDIQASRNIAAALQKQNIDVERLLAQRFEKVWKNEFDEALAFNTIVLMAEFYKDPDKAAKIICDYIKKCKY